jgi:pimeloyl-ACP methyl ester carboxylesterase
MSVAGQGLPQADAELLSDLRDLTIAIQKDPGRKRLIINGWYEKTLKEKGAGKAELGMLLLNILNAREERTQGVEIHVVAERPLVISLHGIRTRAEWQKELSASITAAGFVYHPLDYGFFRAIQLVIPSMREAKTKWFLDEWTAATKSVRNPPSIIAHSMGTYLVARALEKYDELRFDRVILCGSIVNVDYPWSAIVSADRATRILNDYGGRDFWAKAAEWVVNDAGPSGAKGFKDNAGGSVVKRYRPKFRHSDFFYQANYEKTWIPFLQGTDPPEVLAVAGRPINWKFQAVLWAIILAFVLASFFAIRHVRRIWPHDSPRVTLNVSNA